MVLVSKNDVTPVSNDLKCRTVYMCYQTAYHASTNVQDLVDEYDFWC